MSDPKATNTRFAMLIGWIRGLLGRDRRDAGDAAVGSDHATFEDIVADEFAVSGDGTATPILPLGPDFPGSFEADSTAPPDLAP